MTKTENYHLNQWDAADPVRREDFNADNAAIDGALAAIRSEAVSEAAAAQATGDRGLGVLNKLAGDLCRLAYQQDGQGTYTGFKESFSFDGLGADNLVESTSGVAILEPDEGRVRLAVDGWSGGSIPWTSQSLSISKGESDVLLTEEWSPAGNALLNTVAITGKISSGYNALISVVLMRGETELAVSDTGTLTSDRSTATTLTLTFSDGTPVLTEERYRFKIVVVNISPTLDQTVSISGSSIPITATGVPCTVGSFTTAALPLAGQDITVWVQTSEGAAVTAELELPEGWTSMTLEQTRDSQTPEGEACREQIFSLALPQALSAARLRLSLESETECMIYGYGAFAV